MKSASIFLFRRKFKRLSVIKMNINKFFNINKLFKIIIIHCKINKKTHKVIKSEYFIVLNNN